MKITFVEIQNFRKLKSVRIDFSEKTTLLVGANNSGKTSATVALRQFLVEPQKFSTNDFTLSNWALIEAIAAKWEEQADKPNVPAPELKDWELALPSLDIWLEVGAGEIHYVRGLLPTLDWAGGPLGVRLRFEPKKIDDLHRDFLAERKKAKDVVEGRHKKPRLWPESMRSYLDRRLRARFTVQAYLLDAAACVKPSNGIAKPQPLPKGIGSVDGNPLDGLIRVHAIAAQRGLGEEDRQFADAEGETVVEGRKALSEQLRTYYKKHLDPTDSPDAKDLDALEAIEQSENAFNTRLMDGFADAIKELEELNYPGIADPKLRIATLLRPTDGLNHSAALQYELGVQAGNTSASQLRLPEEYNGLGYQNLISIVFRLMAFRDSWMRKGKAAKMSVLQTEKKTLLAPLHLVIVEEPEAHLHPQVQQVFVRKAYDILRTHPDLEDKTTLRTQLLVSTHSSHVAHECPFSSLRYFRRLAAPTDGVPTSAVINLSEVFGPNDKTEKFVTRYIQAVHCDLFFADGAILVEGDAERILVPHFIRKHFPKLHRSYVTVMQVGGSHAHRLQSLIEHLGLTTLIITDIDTGEAGGHHKSIPPMLGDGQVTNNATLKMWHPREKLFDKLIELDEKAKVKTSDFPQFSVRVAYQIPVSVQLEPTATVAEALPSTFEDALAFENLELFRNTGGNVIEGGDLVERFKAILNTPPVITELAKEISEAVRKTKGKAEFALDLLLIKEDLAKVKVPKYIENGLEWLECQLSENEQLVLQSAKTSTSAPAASVAPTEEALSPATVLA